MTIHADPVPPLIANISPGACAMSNEEREDTTVYTAVVNKEEQYSIWPADRELPLGWRAVGTPGSKQEVLAWIEEVWTDMRPLSLRRKMEEAGLTAG